MNNYTNSAELLAKNGWMVYVTNGQSMWPLIKEDPDTIFVVSHEKEILKDDVILFNRDGKLILHRVVGKNENGYTTRGDGMIKCERGIKEEDIVGVLKGYTRKGKNISVDSTGYRVYVLLWCRTLAVRRVCIFMRRIYKRLLKNER